MSAANGSHPGAADRRPLAERLEADARAIVARYPQPRSALLPMLHLVQSEQGYVSAEGIEMCARVLDLSTAQVSAVATFYTQYKRRPVGEYSVGVCTNTLCAVLGGDEIFTTLKAHLGIGNDETTPDGAITLEHIECNAACDYAPVVMVNWEFFDNQTPASAVELVDGLRAGTPPLPTRGAALCSFKEMSRVLAGFYDGRADEGVAAGPATIAGLRLAARRDDTAPDEDERGAPHGEASAEEIAATSPVGYGKGGGPSGADPHVQTAPSDPANPSPAGAPNQSSSAGTPDRTT